MKPVAVALVGIGGYGNTYVNFFKNGEITPEEAYIAAVVDPTAKQAKNTYDWIVSQDIPVFDTLEEMYKVQSADLAIISSPTQFHKQQSTTALRNGSHVLCEKPLVPIAQEANALAAIEEETGYELGVGFQWSFSPVMLQLKQDIIDGKYGRPVMAKTFVSWPRPLEYYTSSTWKGRILDDNGQPILDSILANATAHYLHNIFFVHGKTLETSATPTTFAAELYRANDIESFDTCFLRGEMEEGGEYYYVVSHAVAENHSPTFYYEFENGVITFNHWEEDNIIRGELKTGEVIEYGNPFTADQVVAKAKAMINRVHAEIPVVCTVKTILPHLLVSNAVFDFCPIAEFPSEIIEDLEARGTPAKLIPSMYQTMRDCFAQAKLPSEQKVSWSQPATTVDLKDYSGFTGRKVEGYRPE